MSRGDRWERIFEDDEDRRMFLKVLEESCQRCGWRVVVWMLRGKTTVSACWIARRLFHGPCKQRDQRHDPPAQAVAGTPAVDQNT